MLKSRLTKLKEFRPTLDKARHILKSLSYRIYSTCITITIAALVTGDIDKALAVGFAEALAEELTVAFAEGLTVALAVALADALAEALAEALADALAVAVPTGAAGPSWQ